MIKEINVGYIDFRKLDEEIGLNHSVHIAKPKITSNDSLFKPEFIEKHLFLNEVDSFMRSIKDNEELLKNMCVSGVMTSVCTELNFVADFIL